MSDLVPIPVTEIVAALERDAGNTDTDPRWLAATQLRQMADWERRTLMCRIEAPQNPGDAAPHQEGEA